MQVAYTSDLVQVAQAGVACKWLRQVTYAAGIHQPVASGIGKRQGASC